MIKSLLFSSFRLRAVTFPNRIVIAPMQMYKSAPDGLATDWHFQHLAKYAIGGAGTVMTEGLIVDPIGRNTYGDLRHLVRPARRAAAPDHRFPASAGRRGGSAAPPCRPEIVTAAPMGRTRSARRGRRPRRASRRGSP